MRVVVVGHGMVGHRVLDELAAHRPAGDVDDVVVLGAEQAEPYNRVLLSEVVAGRYAPSSIRLPALGERCGRILTGRRAVHLDRAARLVVDDAGQSHPYDALILATGASARVPDVEGLADLPLLADAGVHVLRGVDDAVGILAQVHDARRATVVGGGVLGLEIALALVGHGLATTLVHGGDTVMDRQLGPAAGAAAAGALETAGVRVRTGARPTAVGHRDGRVTSLTLADGSQLLTDLVVLAAGTQPDVDLARAAGLPVSRGIVVGADLASPGDPRVFAVGDCAQPPQGSTGLVAQGWEQARRLAVVIERRRAALTSGEPPVAESDPTDPIDPADGGELPLPAGGTDVVRVKGAGIDVVSMGVSGGTHRPDGARRLALADPDGGRYLELVVLDRRVVGATCVGGGRVASDLVAAYTRGTLVPADPAQLLLRPVAGAAVTTDSPLRMPDSATLCRCNSVTKGQVVAAWRDGARSVGDVAACTRATTGCGGCADAVGGVVEWLRESDPEQASAPARDAAGV
ncbi:FAD/NAD(P)-binding oxidoreductase [Serinibacter arcticus]|uniref:FAD/NAD(P)-binding oxidoreductase n=1 Tax=Serinibacter arcticus TaxID=1655435 RepID=A0A2U1ZWT1_9MICO|nr:FAD-dependent oxidoreductase [Serinibacter arcticus]PWD51400.1 FAD/NAD(P)-binding oxidoreductase [Serinibacter arcticus]